MAQSTWIYLIHDMDTHLVKIGRAINPTDRLAQIRRQSPLLPRPHRFILADAWRGTNHDEAVLHQRFAHLRVRGEWFDLKPEHIEQVNLYFYDRVNFINQCTQREMDDTEARQIGVLGPDYYLNDPCSGDVIDFLQEIGEPIG